MFRSRPLPCTIPDCTVPVKKNSAPAVSRRTRPSSTSAARKPGRAEQTGQFASAPPFRCENIKNISRKIMKNGTPFNGKSDGKRRTPISKEKPAHFGKSGMQNPWTRQLSTPSISLEPVKFFSLCLPLVGKQIKHFSPAIRFQRKSDREVPCSQLQVTRLRNENNH